MLRIKTALILPGRTNTMELAHTLAAQVKDQWWAYGTQIPPLGPVYSNVEKKQRERRLSTCLSELSNELKRPALELQATAEKRTRQDRLTDLAAEFAEAAFNLEDRHIEALRSYGFIEVTREFVRQARLFDPSISNSDIFQASRNAWSMNFFQLLLGLPVEVTPSVLAYSLLYPYTDNYLDNPAIPARAKAAFSQRFRQRLEGQALQAADAQEDKIFALVRMIENQFERVRYPEVFSSLMSIYHAQTNSLSMLHPDASPYEIDVLGLGIEKGGASVLADGYLVAGSLTPSQIYFMYHYGAFTQLLDDLEDVFQDMNSGIMTVFSQTALHWPLDASTNRTMAFGLQFLDLLDDFDRPGLEPFKEVLRMSILPVLIDAAGQAGRLYTRAYLQQLEEHFPFRFSFLKETRKMLKRRKLGLESLVEFFVDE